MKVYEWKKLKIAKTANATGIALMTINRAAFRINPTLPTATAVSGTKNKLLLMLFIH